MYVYIIIYILLNFFPKNLLYDKDNKTKNA